MSHHIDGRNRRFIPTGVGNSFDPCRHCLRHSVHPHGRGELLSINFCSSKHGGSSPRAWGTLAMRRNSAEQLRFIPTGVGNSPCQRLRRLNRAVHPHGRGELPIMESPFSESCGSSPRAWGTLSVHLGYYQIARFIPTGVGNSARQDSLARSQTVHPHGRGELTNKLQRWPVTCGSSPRAWGTLLEDLRQVNTHRFIPTGVGNSRRRQAAGGRKAVHPHGRGELLQDTLDLVQEDGSSPRAWGTL